MAALNASPESFYAGSVRQGELEIAAWARQAEADGAATLKINGADHYMFGSSFPVFYSWMSQGREFRNPQTLP